MKALFRGGNRVLTELLENYPDIDRMLRLDSIFVHKERCKGERLEWESRIAKLAPKKAKPAPMPEAKKCEEPPPEEALNPPVPQVVKSKFARLNEVATQSEIDQDDLEFLRGELALVCDDRHPLDADPRYNGGDFFRGQLACMACLNLWPEALI